MPVVVYNYLDKPQTVELTLTDGRWFKLLDERGAEDRLGGRRSPQRRATASARRRSGVSISRSSARGSGVADAVKRPIEVAARRPPRRAGLQRHFAAAGRVACSVPPQAIEGSVKAIVKIYPSSFSQLVEGLDAIFQRPYGCFEQTSSTTYPNVLALDYLRQNGKSLPEVEAKARQYIHLGYQRLLSFEVAGGGFDWFGNPPANRTLTAYGLMEFQDMARVHDVDPQLIERTRQWLLDQRQCRRLVECRKATCSTTVPPASMGDDARLGATAYIAWAVFDGGNARAESLPTREFLLSHRPETIDDPYVLALVANALSAMNPGGMDAEPYIDRLDSLKRPSADGKLAWWDSPAGGTMFYGAGRSGSVETTSLATPGDASCR